MLLQVACEVNRFSSYSWTIFISLADFATQRVAVSYCSSLQLCQGQTQCQRPKECREAISHLDILRHRSILETSVNNVFVTVLPGYCAGGGEKGGELHEGSECV